MYHRHTKIGQWKNQEIWKESIFIGCVVNEEGMHFKQGDYGANLKEGA